MAVRTQRLSLALAVLSAYCGLNAVRVASGQAQSRPPAAANNQPSASVRQPVAGDQNVKANAAATNPVTQLQPPQNLQLAPPFTLTPQQQAHLDEVLTNWEQKNSSIDLFMCSFYRWEY